MSPTNDVILFRKSRARVSGSTLYPKISSLSLLQVGRGSYLSSSKLISSGGASSPVGFQALRFAQFVHNTWLRKTNHTNSQMNEKAHETPGNRADGA